MREPLRAFLIVSLWLSAHYPSSLYQKGGGGGGGGRGGGGGGGGNEGRSLVPYLFFFLPYTCPIFAKV